MGKLSLVFYSKFWFSFCAEGKKIPHTLQYEGFLYKKGFGGDLDPPVRPRQSTRAEEFNCRDRNGNGCDLFAIATENRNQVIRLKAED